MPNLNLMVKFKQKYLSKLTSKCAVFRSEILQKPRIFPGASMVHKAPDIYLVAQGFAEKQQLYYKSLEKSKSGGGGWGIMGVMNIKAVICFAWSNQLTCYF
jgi:hypothetical protein